jgi:hypothetical protein
MGKSPRDTRGPIVKTGPTRGSNRSRKSTGQWREKRSDSGKPRKKGCYITSAVCSYKGLPDDCYELTTLRSFRDEYLLARAYGRDLVERYYRTAPLVARQLTSADDFEKLWVMVTQCVKAIEQKKPGLAVHIYRDTFLSLQKRLRCAAQLGVAANRDT